MSEMAPADPRDRLVVLDVLRGVALFGVLLGNTYRLYSGQFGGPPAAARTGADLAVAYVVDLVVQSKAQTLLTFLFGFGFAAQLLRGEARGEPVVGLFVRRMLALFAFGVVHVVLLWWGDVLWTYAIAGFGMLLFLRTSNRTRVIAAAFLILVPGCLMMIPAVREAVAIYPPQAFGAYLGDLRAAIAGSDHLEAMRQHIRFAPMFSSGALLAYQPWLLGRFLLGYVAGARGWFAREGADHLPVFRRMLRWGALAGTLGIAVSMWFHLARAIAGAEGPPPLALRVVLKVLREADYLGLAAAYLAGIVLLYQRPRWRRILAVLAPAGRMPLTVYLSQSLIMTALLYGWGLGLADVLAPAAYLPLCLAVFAAQVAACTAWQRHFLFGPLEWAWRALVYLKLPAMRA